MASANPEAMRAAEKLASVEDAVRRGTNAADEPVTVVEIELRRRRLFTLYPLVTVVALLLLVGLVTVVKGARRLAAATPPAAVAAAVAPVPAAPQIPRG